MECPMVPDISSIINAKAGSSKNRLAAVVELTARKEAGAIEYPSSVNYSKYIHVLMYK